MSLLPSLPCKSPFRLAALAFCLMARTDANIDQNANGLSDVWEAKYAATAFLPDADSDGDGRSNLMEAIVGTDPLQANDYISVNQIQINGNQFTLKWPSVSGKRYRLQTADTLGSPEAWTELPANYDGTNAELSGTVTASTSALKFFRVAVYDLDTDNDGLSDWEEMTLGLDPNNAHTFGAQADLDFVAAKLNTPNVLSITAAGTVVSEGDSGSSFTITRSGSLHRLSIPLIVSGSATSGTDYTALPATVTMPFGVNSVTIPFNSLPDAVVESTESVIVSIGSAAGFTSINPATATILITDNILANGTGLNGQYWKHPTTATDSPYFTGAPTIARIDATVNFDNLVATWPGAPITSGATSNYFSSRWTGEILPEFSQVYTLYTNTDNGARLWVNGQLLINNWPPAAVSSSEKSAVFAFEAGKRYPIVFEHYNNTTNYKAILSWQALSQTKQVVPQARLFPNAAPQILAPYEALTFLGAPPFTYQITASGTPTAYTAANLPPGLSLAASSGLISGTPATAGVWQVPLSATNAYGSGSALLTLTVLQTSGSITREVWSTVPGASVSQIPVSQVPNSTSLLTSLQAPSNSGTGFGARIRGFLTAPADGDYRFFLRADDAAEFRLSDDEEPVNAWKRAELTAPVSETGWAAAATSPLLRLEAGKRYYLEILHKQDAGNDHLALGWAKPGQPDTTASEVVPGFVLTRYDSVTLGTSAEGTLYYASLVPQTGAITNAYGTGSIRLSPDKLTAYVTPEFSNLGSAFQGMHVHDDRLPSNSNIVFDLDEPDVEVLTDGSYLWHIVGVGSLSALDIANGLGSHAYLNIHTVTYPDGEIKGFFKVLDGSSTFTPPPAAPDWTSESGAANTNSLAAARFLQQATFGTNTTDLGALQGMASYDAWIDAECAKPITTHLPHVEEFRNVTNPNSPTYSNALATNSWWRNSIQANDQLRQRAAFAFSEVLVVSTSGPLSDRANTISDFYDTLLLHSFGNFRDMLEAVTLHPAMGRYLDMLRNDKPNLTSGLIPNENYAREILQLFSLGLNRLHPDGSLILSSKGLPIPTYDQDAIIGLAHTFTGWDYNYTGTYRTSFGASSNWIDLMREVPGRHFIGRKRILNNVVLPGISTIGGVAIDPYASHTTAQMTDPAYQALPAQELDAVLDQIFQHPNCGPFLCRQLIQRLVTSTPSRGYVYRVTQKFNDNGSGVRGDLKAVIKAILLDYEARSLVAATAPGFGKQTEPVVRVTQLARTFRPAADLAGTYAQDGGLISFTTPAAHRLSANQKVFAKFSGPTLASYNSDYTVLTVPTTATFTARAKDVSRCTWSQTLGTVTVTAPAAHNFTAGQQLYVRYRDGQGGVLTDGVLPILTVPTTTTLTVAAPDSATRSGNCDIAWLKGSYTQSYVATPTPVTTLTVTLSTPSGLAVGSKLDVSFTPITGQTTLVTNGIYTVASVDATLANRYILTPDSGTLSTSNSLSGLVHAAQLTPVLNRGGTASDLFTSGFSDWNLGSTDTTLGQTPVSSPTVFNFFLPDYQFPGLLAASGLVTPEFQITSDTNVIRQSNFLFGGIYSSSSSLTAGYTNGFTSFSNGAHDIMMDLSPWMGLRVPGTGYWTDTANLRDLIREFSKLLMASRMSQAMEDQIHTFVSSTANVSYAATPTETNRRDRVRAILHLIATSPEFPIQR